MTPEFKEKIDGSSSALEWELHSIFEKMEKMEKKPVETRKLTHCLGLAGTQQQDVAEIFYLLLNKLGSENVKKVFEATVTKTIECEACHTRQRDEPGDRLLLLPLSFYSHDRQSRIESVNDGLRNFLYKKTLSGDDMAFCDICKSKKPATLVQEFTCLPPVLVFQLKRFEYNPLRGFTKIHHSIKIPWTLDVPLSSPNESKSYHLFSRCEHHGNVSGGHYTALIKSTSIEQLYRCSDETVTPWTDPHESEEKEDLWSTETYLLMYRQRSTDRYVFSTLQPFP
uniref:USP domain-containing protein n=2 Tax=Sphenodon punctatus TaxID=8508 RepID=A0A8D0HM46_SPHPU